MPSPSATPEWHDLLVDRLVQTSFAITALLARIGAEHELSLTQLRVLAILRDRRVRMAQLADHLGLEKSTMSGLIDRAERRGLVIRTVSATDRRAVEVTLTTDGVELADRLYRQMQRSLSPMLDDLSASAAQRLQGLLGTLLGVGDDGQEASAG